MKPYSFCKSERLCGKERVKRLYSEGKRMTVFPLRVTYKLVPFCQPTNSNSDKSAPILPQVLLWAPKSLFRHATDRNRLRRQLREAYRLSAQPLRQACAGKTLCAQIAINYMSKEKLPFVQILSSMTAVIQRIAQQIQKSEIINQNSDK